MAEQSNTPLFGANPAVSPESLKQKREMLAQLLKQGLDTSPIRSPWQGAARMAETLVGALAQSKYDTAEKEAREAGESKRFELAQKAGLNPYMAALLSGSGNDPWNNPEIARRLADLAIPQREETPTDIRRVEGTTGRTLPASYIDKPIVSPAESPSVPVSPQQRYGIGPQATRPQPAMPQQQLQGAQPPPPPQAGNAPSNFNDRFGAAYGNPPGQILPPYVSQVAREGQQIRAGGQELARTTDMNADIVAGAKHKGLQAQEEMGDVENVIEAARRAGYGPSAELSTLIGNKTGMDMGNLTENQVYNMLTNRYAPNLRPEGSGGLKGSEYQGFLGSLGGLSTTRAGREIALGGIKAVKDYHMEGLRIANDQTLTNAQKVDQLARREPPKIDYDKLKKLGGGGWTQSQPRIIQHPKGNFYKDPQSGQWMQQ